MNKTCISHQTLLIACTYKYKHTHPWKHLAVSLLIFLHFVPWELSLHIHLKHSICISNGTRRRDFLSDYLKALHVCASLCVPLLTLVNTQLAMLFDTPGGLEDIPHFFYTCIFCGALSSSSSLHLICTISLHPSPTPVTPRESMHPQL